MIFYQKTATLGQHARWRRRGKESRVVLRRNLSIIDATLKAIMATIDAVYTDLVEPKMLSRRCPG